MHGGRLSHPAHLAKIAASVDLISRGRLTLGIGAGFFEDEYRQYGWEFPPRPATRIRQMEEAVELILKLWTEKRTTFRGRYFHAEDAILEPKPVRKPHPPVMIAGSGEQMTLRVVARLADACNLVRGNVTDALSRPGSRLRYRFAGCARGGVAMILAAALLACAVNVAPVTLDAIVRVRIKR